MCNILKLKCILCIFLNMYIFIIIYFFLLKIYCIFFIIDKIVVMLVVADIVKLEVYLVISVLKDMGL